MMIFKVITMTLIITLCAADNRMILQKLTTEQEHPVLRFNRHDIPMSFKYVEGYQYSTPSHTLRAGPIIPNIFQKIQYAPLHGQINQKNKNAAAEYTKVTPTLTGASATPTESILNPRGRTSYGISHLEPRVSTGQVAANAMKCNSPGHNIEVVSSVSRSPGHNAVYRNFPESIQRNQPSKINNFVRPYVVYQNMVPLTTTMMPFELPSENMAGPSITNLHYIHNLNAVKPLGPVVEKTKRHYSPYAKFHRLHLNIARVYSPGQVPLKPPAFADTYSLSLERFPVHSKAYIPPVYQALPALNQKTMLYPVKENQKKYDFRMP